MSRQFEPRKPRQFVGSYRPKIEGYQKASGSSEFLDDIASGLRFPGMLHAKVLRSPFPHAIIKNLDTSAAEKMPGVHVVLRYDDPEIEALKPTTNSWTSFNTAAYDTMYYPNYRDRKVLGAKAHYSGDQVGAVVAAETEEIAYDALKSMKVQWEELAFELDPKEAMKKGAPVIHPEIDPKSNILPCEELCGPDVFRVRGDLDNAFANADEIVEVQSDYHFADQGCLDTRGCLLNWHKDELTCWTNLYQADQTRMYIAQMLDMKLHKVRVICPYIGGSFGRSNTGDQSYYIFTAIAAQRAKRPVKYKHTRQEDFHDTRNAIEWTLKMSATKDGSITGCYFNGIGDAGAYSEHTIAALKFMTGFEMDECLLHHIPNMKMEGYGVYTNKIPSGCKRGIGNNQLNMALFIAVELMAEKLGMDPIDLAIKNFSHEWEPPPNKSVTAVLREGAQRIGWEKRLPTNQGPLIDGRCKKGFGFSLHDGWHTAWQEEPRGMVQLGLRLNPDLSVILDAPMAETGCGSNSCAVWACADHLGFLGITPEDIKWVEKADTETGLKDMVQTDSSVSYLHAELMPEAAAKLKIKILAMAAKKFEQSIENMDIENGRVFVRSDPDKNMSIKELLWNETLVPIPVMVEKLTPLDKTGVPYEATFAEVDVDIELGRIHVKKIVQLNDCGTVMYATGAEAQLIGGQAMALGEALTEEIVYDKTTGIPLNFNWVDYLIPTMLDMPDIEPVAMEVWEGAGEYGACGIGESVTTCTARAIANAVYNATGARVDATPFKPEKVLAALDAVDRAGCAQKEEVGN
ncbi:xanthine dehydrogenase family protein molybdopterin-binding subunit [Desulfobacula sp.]|uniref:xanthine dehydrogenase family protein molybdopterin-binding subunit n=1 Tax=Desulfobacula sp. TaxID=2593537 RepID=UPI002604CF10|nr:xanthine dehydrogenase family protein molybdopterin-binding subunit [Desulfobacula sp.]